MLKIMKMFWVLLELSTGFMGHRGLRVIGSGFSGMPSNQGKTNVVVSLSLNAR